MTQTLTLQTADANLVYDVRGPLPPADGRPPLLMIGSPMDAAGFASLASHFPDRTVVTYDPATIGRSTRTDGSAQVTPQRSAVDLHRIIEELGAGPVDLFGSSGGAVTALALVSSYPDDVRTVVAHEPPLMALLPDADRAFAAERDVQSAYHDKGFGYGMARFIGLVSWQGEFTDEYASQSPADPASFGMPTDDDGARDDALLSGRSNAITSYQLDVDALTRAPTRVVVAVGEDTGEALPARTARLAAAALGQEPMVFPGDHGGFMSGEDGGQGKPVQFAARLREVLES